MLAASAVPCTPSSEPSIVCSEAGREQGPILLQRSGCTGSKVSLGQVLLQPAVHTRAGAISMGGAQFHLSGERVSL